jgi:hypothetical protein
MLVLYLLLQGQVSHHTLHAHGPLGTMTLDLVIISDWNILALLYEMIILYKNSISNSI